MAEILIRSNNSFLFFGKRRIEVEWSLALAWAWAQSRASDWLVLKGLAFFHTISKKGIFWKTGI